MEQMVITGFFMSLVVFLEILHYRERKDLYTRLMSRNLMEYSTHSIEEAKIKIPNTKTKDEFIVI